MQYIQDISTLFRVHFIFCKRSFVIEKQYEGLANTICSLWLVTSDFIKSGQKYKLTKKRSV